MSDGSLADTIEQTTAIFIKSRPFQSNNDANDPISIGKESFSSQSSLSSSYGSSPKKSKSSGWLSFMYGGAKKLEHASTTHTQVLETVQLIEESAGTRPFTPKPILKPMKAIDFASLQRADEYVVQRTSTLTALEVRRMTIQRANQLHFESSSDSDLSITSTSSWGSPPSSLNTEPFVEVKKSLRFKEFVQVGEALGKTCYDRTGIDYEAKRLNPALVLAIRSELNELKSQMEVHPESAHHTQYYHVPESYRRSPPEN